ncbi:MAG: response regulator transcription factor [Clostridia bacterium]|nr:DNA-binding response regulator [Bacillota bacterium]MBO2521350.1 DNA-binding response regulator [Bacillota bacterium]
MAKKILVVDDEPSIVELILVNLEDAGYEAEAAFDGDEALARFREEPWDLVILDIMLPGVDGIEVCRRIRQESQVPIIMLTARADEVDRVLGLEMGADDYITKPFSPRELLARVKAVLRRVPEAVVSGETVRYGRLVLNLEKRSAEINGQRLSLTPREFDLLHLLARNPGRIFQRDFLLEKLWEYEYMGGTRTVDVHIRRLRQKLEEFPEYAEAIETVHGLGYRMRESPPQ